MHDAELARRALGMVYLVPPDESWPALFSQECERLRPYLGCVANDIQHYGSTAVAGLRAKPVIDMMAPVSSLSRADDLGHSLAEAGYKKIDAGFVKRRFFRREPENGNPGYHLHLVVSQTWPVKNELLLRDWLLQHPKIAREYETLKMKLAATYAEDMPRYTEGKTSFLRSVVNDARANLGLSPENDWEE